MRLTEPGVYVSRDGRVAMSFSQDGCETRFIVRRSGEQDWDHRLKNEPSTEGDWQRIDLDAIQWPELPPKPLLCLTRLKTNPHDIPRWRLVESDAANCCGTVARRLTVVPHPENDPEAVAMIEAVKEAT